MDAGVMEVIANVLIIVWVVLACFAVLVVTGAINDTINGLGDALRDYFNGDEVDDE